MKVDDDDTGLRVEALNLALRYPPETVQQVVADAQRYLTFLQGRTVP